MIQEVGVRELKNQASEIVRSVRELHTEYVITYHGQPVARLTPIAPLADKQSYTLTQTRQLPADAGATGVDTETLQALATLRPANRAAIALLRKWRATKSKTSEKLLDEFEGSTTEQRGATHGEDDSAKAGQSTKQNRSSQQP